jgi:DNA-binding MarR family transcriptional regulator/GNAT superfamily N-acetyltransferase
MNDAIPQIRRFNRTVARRLGVLNEKYLGRDRPYVESRLLFEIGAQGATVRTLRERLDIDSGFLSRLLRKLEHKGLAATRRSADDARVRVVRLSRAGAAELRRINTASDKLAQSMLKPLSHSQAQRLLVAMVEVEQLLRASSVEIAPADPAGPEAQRCLEYYFAELNNRFRGGFDPGKGATTPIEEFVSSRGCFLLATLFGEPIGCGALRTLELGVGEIKRMWIAPHARGLGLGRRLLAELEHAALKRRLCTIRLDTNGVLGEAHQLYRSSGYHEIARFNDNPYAQLWFEKTL